MTFRIQPTYESLIAEPVDLPSDHSVAPLPPEVQTWLEDLLLLRGVPLAYIVPDPALLPPESVRFFHIDPNWTARLIDGAFAAANTGGGQIALSKPMLAYLREMVALGLAQRLFPGQDPVKLPMLSGMLIRSEIVRRWPGLHVTALEGTKALTLARKERLSSGLLIVIFAGIPTRVEIAEPSEGTRFGIEPEPSPSIQVRKDDGSFQGGTASVTYRAGSTSVLNFEALADAVRIKLNLPTSTPVGSARLSLSLQQQPFVQIFEGSDMVETGRRMRIQNKLAKPVGGGT